MFLHQIVKVGAVPDLNYEIPFRRAECPHKPVRHAYYLGVSRKGATAEAIYVQLPVLAQATALRPLVPKDVRHGIETQRETEIAPPRGHHARDRRSHLRAQSHLAPAAVDKGISLVFYYFLILRALGLV